MTRWGRLGLRARVTVAFALGSLALTLTLSVLTYTLATNQLIRQREQSALRLTVVNAHLIQDGLDAADPDIPGLLASLDTPAGSQPVLRHRDRWFGSSLAPGDQVVPAELGQDVLGGTAARQRVRVDGRLYLVVGLPLPRVDAVGADGRVPVTADPEAAETVIRADRRRLERVVANLVENAEVHGRGLAGMQVLRADGTIHLLVDDAGPGVPVQFRERVFERFARGPADGAPRGDGAGLGLALVAEQVRLHGGRVWVEDRPGGGARFVVELPRDGP
jgi:Histidine kinase-, DNA gyrase B-, and HSP90-like ATPase